LDNPADMPKPEEIAKMAEPIVRADIMTPPEYIGAIMELCQEKRGVYINMKYIEEKRAVLEYHMPLNEIIYDFFDALKSRTRGSTSLRIAFTVSRAITFPPIAACIGISKSWRGITSFAVYSHSFLHKKVQVLRFCFLCGLRGAV